MNPIFLLSGVWRTGVPASEVRVKRVNIHHVLRAALNVSGAGAVCCSGFCPMKVCRGQQEVNLHARMNLACFSLHLLVQHTLPCWAGHAGSEGFSVCGHPLGDLSWTRSFACPASAESPHVCFQPGLRLCSRCGLQLPAGQLHVYRHFLLNRPTLYLLPALLNLFLCIFLIW